MFPMDGSSGFFLSQGVSSVSVGHHSVQVRYHKCAHHLSQCVKRNRGDRPEPICSPSPLPRPPLLSKGLARILSHELDVCRFFPLGAHPQGPEGEQEKSPSYNVRCLIMIHS